MNEEKNKAVYWKITKKNLLDNGNWENIEIKETDCFEEVLKAWRNDKEIEVLKVIGDKEHFISFYYNNEKER